MRYALQNIQNKTTQYGLNKTFELYISLNVWPLEEGNKFGNNSNMVCVLVLLFSVF